MRQRHASLPQGVKNIDARIRPIEASVRNQDGVNHTPTLRLPSDLHLQAANHVPIVVLTPKSLLDDLSFRFGAGAVEESPPHPFNEYLGWSDLQACTHGLPPLLALAKKRAFLTGEGLELGSEVVDVPGVGGLLEDLIDCRKEVREGPDWGQWRT